MKKIQLFLLLSVLLSCSKDGNKPFDIAELNFRNKSDFEIDKIELTIYRHGSFEVFDRVNISKKIPINENLRFEYNMFNYLGSSGIDGLDVFPKVYFENGSTLEFKNDSLGSKAPIYFSIPDYFIQELYIFNKKFLTCAVPKIIYLNDGYKATACDLNETF